MNENMKYGLFFLGGLALGANGAVAVSRGKLDIKPLAAGLLSRGMDVKDAVLAKVETVKENVTWWPKPAKPRKNVRKPVARAVRGHPRAGSFPPESFRG